MALKKPRRPRDRCAMDSALSLFSTMRQRVCASRSLSLHVQTRLYSKGLQVERAHLPIRLIQPRRVGCCTPPLLSLEGLSGKGCLTVLQATGFGSPSHMALCSTSVGFHPLPFSTPPPPQHPPPHVPIPSYIGLAAASHAVVLSVLRGHITFLERQRLQTFHPVPGDFLGDVGLILFGRESFEFFSLPWKKFRNFPWEDFFLGKFVFFPLVFSPLGDFSYWKDFLGKFHWLWLGNFHWLGLP